MSWKERVGRREGEEERKKKKRISLVLLHGVGPVHLAGAGRGVGHDVLALGEGGPDRVDEAVFAVVEVAEDGLDGRGGLVLVVEGDFAGILC